MLLALTKMNNSTVDVSKYSTRLTQASYEPSSRDDPVIFMSMLTF